MEYQYRKMTYCGEEAAEITGVTGDQKRLSVPAELGGFPVRSVGDRAFFFQKELTEIRLPDSLRRIGRFAFYGCRKLSRIDLSSRVEDVGDGCIRSCGALSEIHVRFVTAAGLPFAEEYTAEEHFDSVHSLKTAEKQVRKPASGIPESQKQAAAPDFRVVRELLADMDREIRFFLELPDGEACLFFPAYFSDFDEDTMARAIHPRFEGCGYAFREAVTRSSIDFRSYDAQFPRTVAAGFQTRGEVALSRLMYPCRLETKARERYEEALPGLSGEFLPYLAEQRRLSEVAFLVGQGLVTREAAEKALDIASALKQPELCGILMEYLRGQGRGSGSGSDGSSGNDGSSGSGFFL